VTDDTTQIEQTNIDDMANQPVSEEKKEQSATEQQPEEIPRQAQQEEQSAEQIQSAAEPASTPAPSQNRRPGDENTIFIGRKSTMGYVLAVVTQFNSGASIVKVKARGKLISKAVDVVEITRGRFLPNVSKDDIIIMTEEVQNEDGSKSKISSIEISLKK
jgi:archaea-specific DNA-binding protein